MVPFPQLSLSAQQTTFLVTLNNMVSPWLIWLFPPKLLCVIIAATATTNLSLLQLAYLIVSADKT
jgi:hypothetical protein